MGSGNQAVSVPPLLLPPPSPFLTVKEIASDLHCTIDRMITFCLDLWFLFITWPLTLRWTHSILGL